MSEPRYIDINRPEPVHLVANLEPCWKPMAAFERENQKGKEMKKNCKQAFKEMYIWTSC